MPAVHSETVDSTKAASPSSSRSSFTNNSLPPLQCAAGERCKALPPYNSLEGSTHFCSNCQIVVHSALLCGCHLSNLEAQEGFSIIPSSLTLHSQDKYHSINHENFILCFTCIDTIKSNNSSSLNTTLSATILNTSTATENETETAVSKAGANKILMCSWDDVVTTPEATNPTKKPKKGVSLDPKNATHVKGFNVGGELIPIVSLSKDHLQAWAIRKQKSGARRLNKQPLCEAIFRWKSEHDLRVSQGLDDEMTDPATSKIIKFNHKRFINVLFGDIMKPKMCLRGKSLKKRSLDDKKKTDEDLFKAFIEQYNDKNQINSTPAMRLTTSLTFKMQALLMRSPRMSG